MANLSRLIRIAALLAACLPVVAHAAKHQTANFLVTARDANTARQVGQYAEFFRRQKALEWLGTEMSTWPDPCTIEVRVTFGGAGGATSFAFDNGQILGQSMVVEGPLERILNSVLPHEITHTVFAYKFRRPLPRWADEGGAVLSEDQQEISRHDLMVRELIRGGRMIPLSRLFVLTEYPRDVMALYAQGFSVANYLVSQRGRGNYLDFVADGQTNGWDRAVKQYYGLRSINELEKNWISWLIAGRGTGADGPPLLASAELPRPSQRNRVVRGQMPQENPMPGDRGFMSNEIEPPRYASNSPNGFANPDTNARSEVELAPNSERSRWLPPVPAPAGVGSSNVIPAAKAIEPYGQSTFANDSAAYRGFDGRPAVPNNPPSASAVGESRFDPPIRRASTDADRGVASRISSQPAEADSDLEQDRRPRRIIPIAVGRTRRTGDLRSAE